MNEEGKADWEIRLERYLEKPVQEAKVDKKLRSSQLQALLTEIEKAAGKAKTWLAANMIPEVKVELDRLRGLLKLLETESPSSIELIASLLKVGVSEKVLKEIYGATEEEIERAKRLLKKRHKFRAWLRLQWVLRGSLKFTQKPRKRHGGWPRSRCQRAQSSDTYTKLKNPARHGTSQLA
jgi:hypothetical protein